jgi:hypothetical protein
VALNSNKFTIEAWFYPTTFANGGGNGGYQAIFSGAEDHTYGVMMDTNGKLQMWASGGSGWNLVDWGGTLSSSVNLHAWNHIALVRDQTVFRLYLNGQNVGEVDSGSLAPMVSGSSFRIGVWGNGQSPINDGYIDEVTITKGYAKYTSNFTPESCGSRSLASDDGCGCGMGTGCFPIDCYGTPYGSAVLDQCGVCGGDNSTCEVICNDGVDNDSDTLTDCADSDCASAPYPNSPNPSCTCSNPDADGDGICADSDCAPSNPDLNTDCSFTGYAGSTYYLAGQATTLDSNGSGVNNNICYSNGIANSNLNQSGTGTCNNLYYVNGSAFTGLYNGSYYINGTVAPAIYVSNEGNDSSGLGIQNNPFKTAQKAFQAAYTSSGNVIIKLGQGNFGGVNLATANASDWPSRIRVYGEGENQSFLGGINGDGHTQHRDGYNITIFSNNSVNLGDITSRGLGAGPGRKQGGNGGNVILTNSISGNINTTGGQTDNDGYSGPGGSGGNVTLTDSVSGNITSSGNYGVYTGGPSGNITLIRSASGNITSDSSLAYHSPGTVGTINLISSASGDISSKGGNSYEIGGNGGNVILTNSTSGKIMVDGGNAFYVGYYTVGGNGGNVTLTNSISGIISFTGGTGRDGSGSIGTITIDGEIFSGIDGNGTGFFKNTYYLAGQATTLDSNGNGMWDSSGYTSYYVGGVAKTADDSCSSSSVDGSTCDRNGTCLSAAGCSCGGSSLNYGDSCVVPSLVDWWKFDGDFSDYGSNGFNGTASGATLSQLGGGSVQFENGGYVDFGNDTVTSAATSLSFWYKADSVNNAPLLLDLQMMGGGTFISIHPGTSQGNHKIEFGPRGWGYTPVSSEYAPSGWTHVVITYNGQGMWNQGNYHFYVNGNELGTSDWICCNGGGTPRNQLGRDSFTGQWGDTSRNYSGYLDDIKIYNGVISNSDISALYALGDGTKYNISCTDADTDGYADSSCGGSDCDDYNANTNPGASEMCDGSDNNCNGQTDENCSDGVASGQVNWQAGKACTGSWLSLSNDSDPSYTYGKTQDQCYSFCQGVIGATCAWSYEDFMGYCECKDGSPNSNYPGGFATSLNSSSSIPVITINTQPSNQTASGGSASLSVSASVTQNATLSYQWQKQEGGSGSFSNISGATSTTLNLSNLTNVDDDGDVYRVVVSATGGATDVNSIGVTLTVDASLGGGSSSTGGSLYAWGQNNSGQMGDGSTRDQHIPELIGTDSDWTAISSGGAHVLAIRGGKLYAWGSNSAGQIGDGSNADQHNPVQIGSAADWTAVSAGDGYSLGIRGGKLYAWGDNYYGQLGDGTTAGKLTPVQIGSASDWTAVSAGEYHSLGIRAGKLYSWGNNPNGQLGNGRMSFDTSDVQTSPVRVGTASDWTHVSAGIYHSVGIRNGLLFAWGASVLGYSDSLVPTQIGSESAWTAISASNTFTFGILGGKLYAWGDNYYGQLGDGTHTYRGSPVQIGSDNTWTAVSAGQVFSLGIKDGKLFAWGDNYYGQLGDETYNSTISPVQIGSRTDWFLISASRKTASFTVALAGSGLSSSNSTPVITVDTQPSNETASGGSASFSVTASVTNSATLSYQWQKQESGVGSFSNVSGATSATLNLSNLTHADDNGDVYRVVVSATGGATDVNSSGATLTVNPCASTGWCVDESMYYVSGVQCPGVSLSGDGYCAGTGTYYLAGTGTTLDSSGNGTYNGQNYTNGSLKSVITIGTQPSNQTASGGSASFSVSASVTQSATLSYQWQKQESGVGSFTNVSGATSTTLNLSNLTHADDDGDVYRVVVSATGGADSVNSTGATLTVNASGGSCQSTDASVASCNGDCYSGAQSLAIGTERQGPGDVLMSLQYNGNHTFKIWKEKCGDRILNASGLVANGWQKKLDRPGTSFGADLTDSNYIQKITGVVCPTNVFVNYDNMTTTNRCLYYFVGFDYAWEHGPFALNYYSNGVLGEDYLTQWSMAGTGNGTGPSWYEGNVKPCADAGFRMPTLYETTATGIDSYYHFPPTDATPIFGGNGIPFTTFTWTSSAMDGNLGDYYSWSGTGDTADHIYYSTQEVLLMCVLPSHGVSSPPPDPPSNCSGTLDACGVCNGDGSSCSGGGGGSGFTQDCSSQVSGPMTLNVSFNLAKYNADYGRASCNCGGTENQSISNSLWYESSGTASWRVDMSWCSSDGTGGQSISISGACTAGGYKYSVRVSSVGGTESSGGCGVNYSTIAPLTPASPSWPGVDGNLTNLNFSDDYVTVSPY